MINNSRRPTEFQPHRAIPGILVRVLTIASAGTLAACALTACSGTGGSGGSGGGNNASGASNQPVATECLLGSWSTTGQTYNGKSLGGAGQVYKFNSDQTASLDYTGSGPVATLDGTGSIQYAGTSNWKISKFVSASPTAGTFTFTITGGTVTADNGGDTSTVPSAGSAQLSWTCDGNSASLTDKVASVGSTETWAMKRTSH